MIPAFVRTRETVQHLTYVPVPYTSPMQAETVGVELSSMGATPGGDRAPDPIRQGDFLGGRGRDAAHPSQDLYLLINPATGLGGEGASWEFEHFGYKQPMPEPTAGAEGSDARAGALNAPLAGYQGMIAWPERANEYRPPWESYSSTIDQRLGADDSYLAR